MDWFTPQFFLQLLIAMASGGVAYGAIKKDLTNAIAGLAREERLREKLGTDTDASIHDIRNKMQGIDGRVSRIEGFKEGIAKAGGA